MNKLFKTFAVIALLGSLTACVTTPVTNADGDSFHESAPAKLTVIDWDGKTQNGAEIQGGVFFYQVIVLTEDGLENTVGGKFVKSQ
jgi:hypothetical protein